MMEHPNRPCLGIILIVSINLTGLQGNESGMKYAL